MCVYVCMYNYGHNSFSRYIISSCHMCKRDQGSVLKESSAHSLAQPLKEHLWFRGRGWMLPAVLSTCWKGILGQIQGPSTQAESAGRWTVIAQ